MWTYKQSSGAVKAPNGDVIGYGYSGNGADLNNPAGQADTGHGPIPCGNWTIGPFYNDPSGKGPVVCKLFPCDGNDMAGRDGGFMIHGDNKKANHTASDGCIILPHALREEIAASEDNLLMVVS
jgi:hypothetical protein